MRNIDTSILSMRYGLEPTLVIGITWGAATGTGETLYYDKTNGLGMPGKILEVAGIEDVTQFQGNGSNANVTVKIDDTDGSIQAIFNAVDVHKVPVNIYQAFIMDNQAASMALIYEGQINSPIVWSEADRTFSFSAVTIIEDLEVGFSADAGEFPNLPDVYVGEVWPLAFGNVKRVPGLTFQSTPVGSTYETIIAVDRMIDLVLQGVIQARVENFQAELNLAFYYQALAAFAGDLTTEQAWKQQTIQIQEEMQQYQANIQQELLDIQNFQLTFNNDLIGTENNIAGPIIIDDSGGLGDLAPPTHVHLVNSGYLFPVGVEMYLQIGPWKAQGTMDATGLLKFKWIRPPLPQVLHYVDSSGNFLTEYLVPLYTDADIVVNPDNKIGPVFSGTTGIGPNKEQIPPGFGLQSSITPEQMTVIPSGSTVTIIGDITQDFIVNIIPTTVTQVWAYKNVNNVRTLQVVPTAYWEQVAVNYGILTAQVVRMKRPLSGYAYENWEDQIYADQTCSVGPNTVDIMAWLIEQYTTKTFDPTSFAATAALLGNYPSNFYLPDRGNILAVLSDMAYQCRCAIWLKNEVFYMKYLPLQVAAVDTITEDDILVNTMQVSCTPTEDIVTKIVANYVSDYSLSTGSDVITVKNNDDIYGLITESDNYYIYTDGTLVQKSATYWIIKKSTTFKLISFNCTLTKLNLETYDTVNLSFSNPYVANGDILALVQSANYDSSTNTIAMTCWVPVVFGTLVYYDLAWPATASLESFIPRVLLQSGTTNKPPFFQGTIVGRLPTLLGGGTGTRYSVQDPTLQDDLGPIVTRSRTDLGELTPSDEDDVIPFQDNSIIPTNSATLITTPAYNFDDLNAAEQPPAPAPASSSSCFPGIVIGQVGGSAAKNLYSVTIYEQGMSNPGQVVQVLQIQINPNDIIAKGTGCQVSKNNVPKMNSTPAYTEYTMQVPVWLA